MDEVLFQSALSQAKMIRAGEISSVELCQLYLERIARKNAAWFSFVRLYVSNRPSIFARIYSVGSPPLDATNPPTNVRVDLQS